MEWIRMSFAESVSREEILELARLEALGVLDEIDSERLNRLFHGVTPSIQSEIRALQASICGDETLLHPEAPDARLRGCTLTRVQDEAAAEQAALAPVASIGPMRSGSVRSNPTSDQAIEFVRLHAAFENSRSDLSSWTRTAIAWRAAAIVAFALLTVSLYYNFASSFYAVRIGQLALDANARDALMRELGPSYRDFADSGCLVRGMAATKRGVSGAAAIYVNSRTGQAFLIAFGLPEEARFNVRMVTEAGERIDMGSLVPSGQTTVLRVSGDNKHLAFARWEIVDSSGEVLLRT